MVYQGTRSWHDIPEILTLNEKEMCVKYAFDWLYSNSDSGKLFVDVR